MTEIAALPIEPGASSEHHLSQPLKAAEIGILLTVAAVWAVIEAAV
jgi:hypothetical protein